MTRVSGLAVLLVLAWAPAVQGQPTEAAPPPLPPPPPPPIVENPPPPPPIVVPNRPLPPLVQNVPPAPVLPPVSPAPPLDTREEDRRSGKLFLSALATFGLSYGLTVLAGAIRSAEDDPAAGALFIPLVGPLLFWDGTNMEIDGEAGATLILSAGAQTVGLIGMIMGIVELTSDGPGDSANY